MKNIRIGNKSYKASNLIFIISYFVFLFCTAYSQTEFENTYDATVINLLQGLAIFLIVFKFLSDDKINANHLLLWIVILFFCLIISFKTTNVKIVIPIIAYIIAGSNVSEKTVIKTSLYSITVIMFITVVGSLIGIIPFNYTIQSNGRQRYALGFIYTTFLANYFFHALLMWLFLRRKCPNLLESIIILLINYAIYYFTNTRAVFYEVIVLVAVCWVMKAVRRLDKSILRYVFLTVFIWCALLALGLQVYYDPSVAWMKKLNTLITSRLYFGHRAYIEYGFTLFGQKITWNSLSATAGNYFYVDSSYMNIAVNYGIVLLVALLVGFTALMCRYVKKNKKYCCVALAFLAIHSITDPQLLSIVCNPFLVLLGSFIPLSRSVKYVAVKNSAIKCK